MGRVVAGLAVAFLLGACAQHPPLIEPSGPYRAMNAGQWTPDAADLMGPRQPIMPAQSPYAHPIPPPPPPLISTGRPKPSKPKDTGDAPGSEVPEKDSDAATMTPVVLPTSKNPGDKIDVAEVSGARKRAAAPKGDGQ